MASLQFDEKAQTYRVRFRFAGKGYFRSLKTADPREAEAACGVVESTINAVERGWLVLPDGADPGVFIVSGGKVTGKPEPAPPSDPRPRRRRSRRCSTPTTPTSTPARRRSARASPSRSTGATCSGSSGTARSG
jgi:hypothetical protein